MSLPEVNRLPESNQTKQQENVNMGLNDTPRADRLHIGLFGKRNSGKSSLINALTGQQLALVSDTPGTTADPVFKAMELHPIGPVVFIDTAGFDDEGDLGELRVQKTREILPQTDLALVIIDDQSALARNLDEERRWIMDFSEKDIPVIAVLSKRERLRQPVPQVLAAIRAELGDDIPVLAVSAEAGAGLEELRHKIAEMIPEDFMRQQILSDLVDEGSLVLLVMPQDIQAPKGRLILPQVQTLRELLDRRCTAVACTADGLAGALGALGRAPDLIITDSQCFKQVYDAKPASSRLTSFSVLFAAYKGDIEKFVAGASQLDEMTEKSRVLIAEACTHVPLSEDIGREKIPNLLRKKFGRGIEIVNVCGNDFPPLDELQSFDLVIHCGACMFNRRLVLSRIGEAQAAGVPITNYGIVLAKLAGILDKIDMPK